MDLQKLLIEGKDGEWVEGFHCYVMPKERQEGAAVTYIHAARAALSLPEGTSQLKVKLQNAYFETRNPKGEVQVVFAEEAEPLVFDLKNPRKPGSNSMSNEEIRAALAANPSMRVDKVLKMNLEIASRYSFSLACLAFAFVAVPLGLQSRRRDTSGGLILSLLLGTGYFLITMMADQFKKESLATMVLWAPNVICVLLGVVLFRRARYK